jgi:hypothetical protein
VLVPCAICPYLHGRHARYFLWALSRWAPGVQADIIAAQCGPSLRLGASRRPPPPTQAVRTVFNVAIGSDSPDVQRTARNALLQMLNTVIKRVTQAQLVRLRPRARPALQRALPRPTRRPGCTRRWARHCPHAVLRRSAWRRGPRRLT